MLHTAQPLMPDFTSDYTEGAHPLILQRLLETNLEQTAGYGLDPYCEAAKEKIRAACACPQAEIHFLVGGTQANATVIDALLRPYQGVISAQTGHINGHEAGAIEHSGHKVLALPHTDGKLSADTVRACFEAYAQDETRAHTVMPGMVYLSHPTECGTLYTRTELEALYAVCKTYGVPLFVDGARLGYGLAAAGTDVTLPVLAQCCDVFYIGGTKVGALFGEAVVFTRAGQVPHFFSSIKQHGALLAKGRLLGLQFDTLFTDDLYTKIARHAVQLAQTLCEGLCAKGVAPAVSSPTNQQFFLLDNTQLATLSAGARFTVWERPDAAYTVVRLVTSWATTPQAVQALIDLF